MNAYFEGAHDQQNLRAENSQRILHLFLDTKESSECALMYIFTMTIAWESRAITWSNYKCKYFGALKTHAMTTALKHVIKTYVKSFKTPYYSHQMNCFRFWFTSQFFDVLYSYNWMGLKKWNASHFVKIEHANHMR